MLNSCGIFKFCYLFCVSEVTERAARCLLLLHLSQLHYVRIKRYLISIQAFNFKPQCLQITVNLIAV